MDRRKLLVLVPVLLVTLYVGAQTASAGQSAAPPRWRAIESSGTKKAASGAMGTMGTSTTRAQAMDMSKNRVTPAMREAAAKRAAAKRNANPLYRLATGGSVLALPAAAMLGVRVSAATAFDPQGMPDYLGTVPNYANSQLPSLDESGNAVAGTGIRKFVDSLPGLNVGAANDLGQYIPVAIPDQTTFPGADYYVIELVQYTEKLHSDIPTTTLRGYRQANTTDTAVSKPSYLGPTIVAQRDRPVRVKFVNKLPTGAGGDLFLPTDTTAMGAGIGPDGVTKFTQNRATLHLHGGATPWISDGTPNQWTTPANENTPYPKGVSVTNVPDMWYNASGDPVAAGTPNATTSPGPGAITFYYTNQQSARLMWYHDHAYGLTRLNVYAGEVAGYVLRDGVEKELIDGNLSKPANQRKIAQDVKPGTIPADEIPLIIQDKTFVPNDAQMLAQDPTWDPVQWGGPGNLWFPHVYMPNQNPADDGGANAMGRWDYGPWFWPPMNPSTLIGKPIEVSPGVFVPGTPNPSLVPEGFMDTAMVNGTPYPYVKVAPKAYRLRILNGANDRSFNLQLYYAKSNTSTVDANGNLLQTDSGEVPMVPAAAHPGDPTWPATWPKDGRDGGVPDPAAAGPSWIQIGTEGGFLPKPVVIRPQPVGYNYNRRDIVVLNVQDKSLMLGPAERADVIVDFSAVPPGSKIIMYNDAPAPVPAFDPRYDYYTGDPDQTSTGGAPSTKPGYGPNTRTVMQFQVEGTPSSTFDTAALNAAIPAAYRVSQDPPIVPEKAYGSPTDNYARIESTAMTFKPDGSGTSTLTVQMQPKAIQELFELAYGRMNATLGVELPFTNFNTQTTIPLGYLDPATERITDSVATSPTVLGDGTQIWKITHNGVDTHVIHFHLFNVQVINRVGWDGAIRPPDANELGWKESVRMNPLEDCIVAMRPIAPTLPFKIGDSIRPLDPTMPVNGPLSVTDPTTGNKVTVNNLMTNFGWEYVWHCHLLGHEENDMMRPIIFNAAPAAATDLTGTASATAPTVTLNWVNHATVPKATNYLIQRATNAGFTTGLTTFSAGPAAATYSDASVQTTTYYYRVRAESANAYAAWTNVATVVTPNWTPLARTNLAVTTRTTNSVAISWTNPAGGAAPTSLAIQIATAGATGPWTTKSSVSPTSKTATITGLTTRTNYWIRVVAVNAVASTPSNVISTTTR